MDPPGNGILGGEQAGGEDAGIPTNPSQKRCMKAFAALKMPPKLSKTTSKARKEASRLLKNHRGPSYGAAIAPEMGAEFKWIRTALYIQFVIVCSTGRQRPPAQPRECLT